MDTKVKSSERTLALFELFSLEQTPLTIKKMSEGLGIPQSSTSVLVKSLVDMGYLERNERARTYYPTLRIALLGTWLRQHHRRAGQLPQLLEEVTQRTGIASLLAMRNGIYSQYLMVHSPPEERRIHVESGMLYPLACSSTGWCLLSLETKQNIDKIVRRTMIEAKHAHWRASAKYAPENVAHVLRHGFAFSKGEIAKGLGAISILLPSIPGAYAASIGVGGTIEEVEAKKDLILDALKNVAASVRTLSDKEAPPLIR